MKLYIVRHGQSKSAAGCYVDEELTNTGREHGKKIANLFNDRKIDVIFCSPLKRMIQTAKLIR